MIVNELEGGKLYSPLFQQKIQTQGIDTEKSNTFADTLRELVLDTNTLQKDSAEQTERMIKGEPVDMHDVMIAAEKAKSSFELLLELRNRALDLYREVMRIQV